MPYVLPSLFFFVTFPIYAVSGFYEAHPNSECEQPIYVIGLMVVRRPILALCGITPFIKDKYITTCQCVSLKQAPMAHMFKLDQADNS